MRKKPWTLLEKQKEDVMDDPPRSAADVREGFPKRPYFERLYEQAGSGNGDRAIPLSFYTKACAWASDYPWLYRRVMGYINPEPLAVVPFGEYVLRVFGCNLDTLAQLIADEWFVPLLDEKDAYPDHVQDEIAELFADAVSRAQGDQDIEPRYVNLIDLGLKVRGLEVMDDDMINRAEGADRLDIEATKAAWKQRSPWSEIPRQRFTLYGVEHDDLQEYVVERAVKLRLVDRALGLFSEDGESVANVQEAASSYVDGDGNVTTATDLAQTVYKLWNNFGTPAYYCGMSGTVDMGPKPLTEIFPSSVQGLLSKAANRLNLGLQARPLRPINPGNLQFWASDNVSLKQLFAYGPDGVSELSAVDRYRFLANRAEAHETYYAKMLAEGRGVMARNVLDGADDYGDVLETHRDTAPTRSNARIRQIATSIGDVMLLNDVVEPLMNLDPHRVLHPETMTSFGSALTPSVTALLVNFGTATIRVPEWQGRAPADGKVLERRDVSHADIWQVPYGNRTNYMNQFSWITKEALLNTFVPWRR